MPTPSIILKNISANQYGINVLNNISFDLADGQHLAIIGESGSGKSSLAKALAGKLFSKGNIEKTKLTYTAFNNKKRLSQKRGLCTDGLVLWRRSG